MNGVSLAVSRCRSVVLLVLMLVCAAVVPRSAAAQQEASDPGRQGLGAVETASLELAAVQPPNILNYQGYLTNGAGSPLSARVDMQAMLWDALDGGTLHWGPEIHPDVAVEEGLFYLPLGSRLALTPALFARALFLQVEVDGTSLPRQPLRASPYAFGVLPGAAILGSPPSGEYALRVVNNSTADGMRGLLAMGQEYGLVAESLSANGVGVYTPDFVQAQGYKSSADSYLFVPGSAGVSRNDGWNDELVIAPGPSGTVAFRSASRSGFLYFYIPITVPAVLYGQPVTVEELQFQYQVENPASYITEVSLNKGTGLDASEALAVFTDDLKSTTPVTVTLTPTPENSVLSAAEGPLQVCFTLWYVNNMDFIRIAWVRLRLGHL